MPEKSESVSLLVKIDGKEEIKSTTSGEAWKTTAGAHVVSLTVDMKIDAPDAFVLQFMASHEGKRTVYDHVKEGSKIELGFGYGQAQPLFEGEVVYVDGEYSSDGQTPSLVTVRGFEKAHRLHRGHTAKSYGDGKTDMEAGSSVDDSVSTSGAGIGAAIKAVSDGLSLPKDAAKPKFKTKWAPRPTSTTADFAKNAGQGRELDASKSPVVTVCFDRLEGTNPRKSIKVRFSVSTFPSYNKVRVRGWDNATKQSFVVDVEKCSDKVDSAKANGWTAGWQHAGKAHWGNSGAGATYERVGEFCENKEEAQELAQSLFDQMALKHFTGECEVQGDPGIIPGAVVELKGFGPRASGKVMVTEATHMISSQGLPYITAFKFASTASGNPT